MSTMPTNPSRTSKEWKASAQGKALAAEQQAAARRQLQIQLEEIQAQMKKAEEIERKNNEQALIEIQAAKEQEFVEISLTKQSDFRDMLADDVFTRAAQTFRADTDHEYIFAVMEGQFGYEELVGFKAMLCDVIAGNDIAYLSQAARKIAERRNIPISEDDLAAASESVACLDRYAMMSHLNDTSLVGKRDAITTLSQSTEPVHLTEQKLIGPTEEEMDNKGLTSVHETTVPGAEPNGGEKAVKGPERSNAMDRLESMTGTTQAEFPSDVDSQIDLKDSLGNLITGEESCQIEHTPRSTPRKRSSCDEGTPTPSEAGSTTTPKKRKTAARTPSVKFKELMEERDHITKADLTCSVCCEEPQTPRVSTNCHHVYCNNCLTKVKQGAKGKDAHATVCCHTGCDSTLGAMSHVTIETFRKLREHITEDGADEDMEDMTDAVSRSTEMTEMTDAE